MKDNKTTTTQPASPSILGPKDETPREPRWPAATAFFTLGLRPATTARRTTHLPLAHAWLIHVVTAALAIPLGVILLAWFNTTPNQAVLTRIAEEVHRQAGRIANEYVRSWELAPYATGSATLAVIAGVESASILLAWGLMPWGARDEPMVQSFRHALRRVWVQSPHVLALSIAVGLAYIGFEYARQAYQGPWDVPPWYIDYRETIDVTIGLAATAWGLWALLRTVGAERQATPLARPPLCEFCGYDLTHKPEGGRCSECGVPLEASLGQAARPGTPADHCKGLGSLRAWWQCLVEPLVRPTHFGRLLRVRSPATGYRWFLAVSCPLTAVSTTLGIWTLFAIIEGKLPTSEPDFMAVSAVLGCMVALISILVPPAAAAIVGISFRLHEKRNLLPASVQAATYLYAIVIVTPPSSLFAAAIGYHIELAIRGSQTMLGPIIGVYGGWLGTIALGAVVYLAYIGRVTAAARYANK